MAKNIQLNIKANLKPLKEKLERLQAVEKELDSVMKDYLAAVHALENVRIPFSIDPVSDQEQDEEEVDRFSISPYEYPEEFFVEEDFEGANIAETPFATVDDYEGLG